MEMSLRLLFGGGGSAEWEAEDKTQRSVTAAVM